MGISPDDGVRIEHVATVEDDRGQVLEIDLMDNTGTWWHDPEVVEGLGAPLKELEALSISGELKKLVLFLGVGGS